jgi:hypothetical protein
MLDAANRHYQDGTYASTDAAGVEQVVGGDRAHDESFLRSRYRSRPTSPEHFDEVHLCLAGYRRHEDCPLWPAHTIRFMRLTSAQLREIVMRHWDPIGVYHAEDDELDRAAYWDEYDTYLPALASRLQDGDLDALVTYLGELRTREMGLSAQHDLDVAAARVMFDWYTKTQNRST